MSLSPHRNHAVSSAKSCLNSQYFLNILRFNAPFGRDDTCNFELTWKKEAVTGDSVGITTYQPPSGHIEAAQTYTGGKIMTLNLTMPGQEELKPRITVFGVGGAGGNAVNNMIEKELEGVEFVVANHRRASASALARQRSHPDGCESHRRPGRGCPSNGWRCGCRRKH